ncbi:Fur family transcriptional regulator [Anaerocolumna sp. MB42-C2]|uniref:Fur family transcriptional regulator n=1 Tax=Anaerocolumna sp. MB42-C2 TaxID=3070997 RepID=UPI0027E180D4|nr:Fur family transcriptional regulator [Anaerocolumna sp. MB42-C2]WMJ86492.1 Fur family transcriptional regulator [Anaerocolumna sp. MB42-C2]
MDNNTLKSADLKQTKKRILILSVLEAASNALTAEEIAELTSKDMKMSISTIYRALNALADKNVIIKALHQDGKTYYEINNHTHRHSLICTLCNESIPINACPLESLENYLASETGYVITGHNLEFFGICPKCAAKKANTK